MGARRGGRVKEALEALRASVLKYLAQVDLYSDDDLLRLSAEQENVPMPPIYDLYLAVEKEKLPLVNGSFFDQPHLLSRAMWECRNADAEYYAVRRRNEQLLNARS